MSLKELDGNGNFKHTTTDKLIHEDKNRFKGWLCSAGLKGLHIDHDGNIWKAVCFSADVDKFNYAGWGNYIKNKSIENGFFKDNLFNGDSYKDWADNHPKYYTRLSKEYKKTAEAYQKLIFANDKKSYKGIVGNIWEGFFEEKHGILSYTECPYETCGCGSDIWYPKIKNINYENYCSNLGNSPDKTLKNNDDFVAIEPSYPINYQVLWDLSRYCNYDCDYCWPSTHNPVKVDMDNTIVIRTLDSIVNWLTNEPGTPKHKLRKSRFFFGGGEPTIFPGFFSICNWLYDHNQIISISTNGTNDLGYYEKLAHVVDNFLFSVHFKSMKDFKIKNEQGILENIKKVIEVNKILLDRDKWVEVKIMAPPGYVEKAIEFYHKCLVETNILEESEKCFDKKNYFKRLNGSITIVPIREIGQSNQTAVYNDKENELLRNFYANII